MKEQMSFEFKTDIHFIPCTGTCKCGYEWKFDKTSIAIDMFAPCPKCGAFIKVT